MIDLNSTAVNLRDSIFCNFSEIAKWLIFCICGPLVHTYFCAFVPLATRLEREGELDTLIEIRWWLHIPSWHHRT